MAAEFHDHPTSNTSDIETNVSDKFNPGFCVCKCRCNAIRSAKLRTVSVPIYHHFINIQIHELSRTSSDSMHSILHTGTIKKSGLPQYLRTVRTLHAMVFYNFHSANHIKMCFTSCIYCPTQLQFSVLYLDNMNCGINSQLMCVNLPQSCRRYSRRWKFEFPTQEVKGKWFKPLHHPSIVFTEPMEG